MVIAYVYSWKLFEWFNLWRMVEVRERNAGKSHIYSFMVLSKVEDFNPFSLRFVAFLLFHYMSSFSSINVIQRSCWCLVFEMKWEGCTLQKTTTPVAFSIFIEISSLFYAPIFVMGAPCGSKEKIISLGTRSFFHTDHFDILWLLTRWWCSCCCHSFQTVIICLEVGEGGDLREINEILFKFLSLRVLPKRRRNMNGGNNPSPFPSF